VKVVGFAGYSESGKTTLVERLIPLLRAHGQRVAVLKHAHHSFDIDHPGKDSHRHRQAGASEVLIASNRRLALMREYEQEARPSVHALLAQISPGTDWVLVEGFKSSDLPKVEVWREQAGHALRHPQDQHIVAVATDTLASLAGRTALPLLDLNQPAQLAGWLMANAARFDYHPPKASP
jgi:molybdopterin-guanine dinucleotide biosynthesis protein B